MKFIRDLSLLDVGMLLAIAMAFIVLLAWVVVCIGYSASLIDCEFRPTSERCTVLHERSGPASW